MVIDRELPLQGIKVLELGHTVMGPTCGLKWADMREQGASYRSNPK